MFWNIVGTVAIVGAFLWLVGYVIWTNRSKEARYEKRERERARRRDAATREREASKQRAARAEAKLIGSTNRAKGQIRASDKKIKAPISQVGDRSGGTLACPKCGGTNFKAKRSGKAKIASIGAAPLTGGASLAGLAKASQVKCVTCGTYFKRG